ncbi:cytochrome c nitrite reductase pentaheme subunit [Vibrio hepatarius]|uniref:Cysteine hydrolase n=1 Tax=Vibrio hepatarius TaxID=171383 RepID=A0A0M0HYB1_9VIBR|nr:cytochrome c nitrite reductase pentaheme subunit [Vibrio hepatarius]KOO07050.1 cysteine hydrolase [Vibrio hepatarius]NIY84689.1 cytochrome c nitrite reductase pentaheme subunit [Vibrio hepatarius]NOI12601.1 cytochrome c nitrite reductase pentaheme subunit [Vibrio hepatarius]NVJ55742.1 cytochrome c nitrite reductase pentaheme subunit [Vibrionaceae bacterium]
MGNIKLAIVIMLKSLLAFCLYGYSLHAVADTSSLQSEGQNARHEVTLIRDKDYKCVQCHKDAKETLQGSHGEDAHKILGREVNCTECHNNIGPDHREGAPKVTKYSSAQSQQGTDKVFLDPSEILKANSQCTDCHQPKYLREDNWTHDVHAKNLTCSNCHDVHASKTKVLSLDRKSQIKLCVDCHSDFNQNKKEE